MGNSNVLLKKLFEVAFFSLLKSDYMIKGREKSSQGCRIQRRATKWCFSTDWEDGRIFVNAGRLRVRLF